MIQQTPLTELVSFSLWMARIKWRELMYLIKTLLCNYYRVCCRHYSLDGLSSLILD